MCKGDSLQLFKYYDLHKLKLYFIYEIIHKDSIREECEQK